jgi:hypothetical protein
VKPNTRIAPVLSVNVRPVTVSFRPPARPGEGVGGGGSSLGVPEGFPLGSFPIPSLIRGSSGMGRVNRKQYGGAPIIRPPSLASEGETK